MEIVSQIEEKFRQQGLINEYADVIASSSEIVSLTINDNGIQTLNLQQNEFLDSKHLKAVEFLSAEQLSYGFAKDVSARENLPEASLGNFIFKLKKDTAEIFIAPAYVMNTKLNNGKFFQIDSPVGNHCIGDSEILQISTDSYSGYIVNLRFWYND